jgi:LysM repeat protein
MAGRISRLGQPYVNPDMPPEVAAALAEQGFNPDGTRRKIEARDAAIRSDWAKMGFMPFQTVADPRAGYVGSNRNIFQGANSPLADTGEPAFGAITRGKLDRHSQQIDADMARTNALVDALLNGEQAQAAPEPMPTIAAMPSMPIGAFPAGDAKKRAQQGEEPLSPPKPRARPRPSAYTVKAGDNPTKIAQAFGMTLKELEAKNPGILKKARRLQVGATVQL